MLFITLAEPQKHDQRKKLIIQEMTFAIGALEKSSSLFLKYII